jgi:hypothetical protein
MESTSRTNLALILVRLARERALRPEPAAERTLVGTGAGRCPVPWHS